MRVGIVGGGQLARMLHQAALDLDLPAWFLVRPRDEGIASEAARIVVGALDADGLSRLADIVDVITFEHELTPPEVLTTLEAKGTVLAPSARAMQVASNKRAQRELFERLGLPVPAWELLATGGHRLPTVAKAVSGGYDGRGVRFVSTRNELERLDSGTEWILEEPLLIEHELAVLVVGDRGGAFHAYPAVESTQVDGICVRVAWPPRVPDALATEAGSMAVTIAEELGIVGVLAVEFFVADGSLFVNELAPRVHNSGHLTIEAASTSQFENHLRAVAGLPIGPCDLRTPAVMRNLIGLECDLGRYLPPPGVRLHRYGKTPRPGRKVGHLTATAPTLAEAEALADLAYRELVGDA